MWISMTLCEKDSYFFIYLCGTIPESNQTIRIFLLLAIVYRALFVVIGFKLNHDLQKTLTASVQNPIS